MCTQSLISGIIPSFDDESTFCRVIQSVLAQTYREIEIVGIDDNGVGADNHLKIIMQQYKKDVRIKYVFYEKNINGAAARNTRVK